MRTRIENKQTSRENANDQSKLFLVCIWLVERMARVFWTNRRAELRKTKPIPDCFRHLIENSSTSKQRYQSKQYLLEVNVMLNLEIKQNTIIIYHKLQHLQCTVMLTVLVTRLPTPFSAVHLYSPSSWLPRMVKGKFTRLSSATFVQVILGAGLPSAKHIKFTSSPLFTTCSPKIFVILDASLKGTNHQKVIRL